MGLGFVLAVPAAEKVKVSRVYEFSHGRLNIAASEHRISLRLDPRGFITWVCVCVCVCGMD